MRSGVRGGLTGEDSSRAEGAVGTCLATQIQESGLELNGDWES